MQVFEAFIDGVKDHHAQGIDILSFEQARRAA
jgi:hypothetical protein